MTTIPQQHVIRLECVRPALSVSGMLDSDSTPSTEGGRGGWTSFQRPRRGPIVEWTGPEVESYTLELRLMEGATPTGADQALRDLDKMSRMPRDNVAPPLVRVSGLVPIAGRMCAIESFVVEESVRDERGRYEQARVVVNLLVVDNTGDGVLVARRVPAVHRARRGDTIAKLAIRYYGSVKHAKALARAQRPRIRDIRKPLPVNKLVRLP